MIYSSVNFRWNAWVFEWIFMNSEHEYSLKQVKCHWECINMHCKQLQGNGRFTQQEWEVLTLSSLHNETPQYVWTTDLLPCPAALCLFLSLPIWMCYISRWGRIKNKITEHSLSLRRYISFFLISVFRPLLVSRNRKSTDGQAFHFNRKKCL